MNEAVRALGAKEAAAELIHSHIDAFLAGEPDREAEDVELARNVGLKVERTMARWADAKKQVQANIELWYCVRPRQRR